MCGTPVSQGLRRQPLSQFKSGRGPLSHLSLPRFLSSVCCPYLTQAQNAQERVRFIQSDDNSNLFFGLVI